MKLETLKDFEALLRVCKKHGVESVKVDGIEFTLDLSTPDAPKRGPKPSKTIVEPFGEISETDKIEGLPSYEDMLFYSVSGQTPPTEDQ